MHYLLMFEEQSGLKAIEYHVDGGSDMAVQLPQGGQVHGEGGTRIVYVPVPGKRSYCLCMCHTCSKYVHAGGLFALLKWVRVCHALHQQLNHSLLAINHTPHFN